MPDSPPKVAVAGSLNVDYLAFMNRLPVPGETVAADDFEIRFGGKGANQAIAAARQEVDVCLIGAAGDDEIGTSYLNYLANEGVDIGGIARIEEIPTGSAFISIDDSGENTIVVAGGANGYVEGEHIRSEAPRIQEADVLLVQFEIPLSAVTEALRVANRKRIVTVVNPSPFRATFPWGTVRIDFLVVNEGEAGALLDFVPGGPADAPHLRSRLEDLGVQTLIVTRGSDSTLVFGPREAFEVDTLAVLPLDTVGAGDAFAGCLAARLAGGEELPDAVRAANCAGALTTLGRGAQDPIPDREWVEQHIGQI